MIRLFQIVKLKTIFFMRERKKVDGGINRKLGTQKPLQNFLRY